MERVAFAIIVFVLAHAMRLFARLLGHGSYRPDRTGKIKIVGRMHHYKTKLSS